MPRVITSPPPCLPSPYSSPTEEVAWAGKSLCFTDSFFSGFPASPACQTSLLKSPASPSMSQVSCGKKPDFISGCNGWAFWLYVASGGSLGLPLVHSAFDCWMRAAEERTRALACPEAHEDKRSQCALQGSGAPGCGVFPVFPVTWIAHYLIIFIWEMWQAGESWPLLSTWTAIKGLCLMVLLVIWAGTGEQRKREEKANQPSCSSLSGSGTEEALDISQN